MKYELIPNHLVNVDEQLEATVLGSVLNEPSMAGVMLKYIRKPAVFYNRLHQLVYEAIATLYLQSEPIDLVIINRHLRTQKADEAIDYYFLTELSNKGYLNIIDSHCLSLLQLSIKRYLSQYGADLRKSALDPGSDPVALLSKLNEDADAIMGNLTSMRKKTANDYMKEVYDDIIEKQSGQKKGITFGVKEIDERTGGFPPGSYIILAAGTAMGKTGFMIHAIRHQCLVEKNAVGCVTIEMSGADYMARFFAAVSDYSNSELNRATTIDLNKLYNRTQVLADMPLHIHDVPLESLELQYIIREWVRRQNVKMVVVDYIQLVEDPRSLNTRERVSNISRSLRNLARELGIVIVAISQMSRDWERRKDFDKRPQLSDLKETSQLEQDATAVLFLFRPSKCGLQYEGGIVDEHTMELHALKLRGARATDRDDPWLLDYDGACNRISRYGTMRLGGFSALSGEEEDKPHF
ncbi:hypothetical protein M0L20_14835 [Spirosoma sp. RP8]|uniref:DNA 5'-3' helicase n=1 Tax=Spirosoma liriopis TaxID=2937440 RepID=A0ABT0HLW4_9BACT|nr:DnaB-like helicase C-terminal domain-containing protein [Spirosoma liriopis]MCK8493143.1 hypothetical protein [Spirosoma liriopis]